MFTIPNSTKAKEKNTLIALTAATNSVAFTSIYEYYFHISGAKKCQIPKPIEAQLPIITKILTRRSKITLKLFDFVSFNPSVFFPIRILKRVQFQQASG
jgi:hypothetical protein